MCLTYKKSGVDYTLLDPVKKMAQEEGLKTLSNIHTSGFSEVKDSRGESAYVLEAPDCFFAFVVEGLGTKNLIAEDLEKITGKSYYNVIGFDTVISILMDLVTVGAKPLTVLSYWALGASTFLNNKKRLKSFITGWRKACDENNITWGGGETPTLKNIIYPNTIDLAGAAFGIIKPKDRVVLGNKLREGDIIILFESSGIHVNGLSLARKLANKLKNGFTTKLPSGVLYGEALLTPTLSYNQMIQDIQNFKINIHYMVNITGHGWRKIIRAKQSFSYIINSLPPVPEIFKFIQKHTALSDSEMYGTFNMGAGLAVFVNPKDAEEILKISKKHKIKAWVAGTVKNGSKKVIIQPINVTYKESDLNIR